MKLDTLKSRIGSSHYEVDADAVAEAIVNRLLAARRELQETAQAEASSPLADGGAVSAG